MAATDFQMQPLDLSCPARKDLDYPVQDLSSRRRRASTSPPPLTTISPPPLTSINTGIHPRIRIRADLTSLTREDSFSSNDSYHIRRRTRDYEEDHECHLHTNGKEGIRQLLMFTFISYFQIFWLKSSLYEQNICHVTLKHK